MAIVQKNPLTDLQQHKTTLMMQTDLRGGDDGKKQKETSSSVGMAQWGSTELDAEECQKSRFRLNVADRAYDFDSLLLKAVASPRDSRA
ncbi:hypothetical protein E4U46_001554 [Claviceps purpurea]|nr:hypothetical protein E4U36_000749 [Claviceps purpurea]KAG6296735.1 hypothetical protein E4U46_001554 [Claviceps purpurea]